MSQNHPPYVGRFAPSPTGPLHLGSLLAAVASYLDAKANNGTWLLRIEDVDQLRTVSGAETQILRSLEQHGLHWDGSVSHQTDNNNDYLAALDQLIAQRRVFYCNCTRASLRQQGSGPYPGYCRSIKHTAYVPANNGHPASHAIRFAVDNQVIAFDDRILGGQSLALETLGDFIIRRRDSLFAYQLAVTVDDARQGVSHIVRGADLLSSTPWQIALQQALALPATHYAHFPLLTDRSSGDKLSKQTGAAAIVDQCATSNLVTVLGLLGQQLPADAIDSSPETLLNWAVTRWDIGQIPKTDMTVPTSPPLS